jgi:hypothetical protein
MRTKIGIYTTLSNVDDMLNQYKELYPNEIIKVFEIPGKRIWKYWVGTNESYLREIDLINKKNNNEKNT